MGLLTALGDRTIYLDANLFIYLVEGHPAHAATVLEVFQAIEQGRVSAVTSELTLAELLVKPFRTASGELLRLYEEAIHERGGLRVTPVTRDVLVESARLRARESLRLPDGIHIATACLEGCAVFLTNDQRIQSRREIEVLRLPQAG